MPEAGQTPSTVSPQDLYLQSPSLNQSRESQTPSQRSDNMEQPQIPRFLVLSYDGSIFNIHSICYSTGIDRPAISRPELMADLDLSPVSVVTIPMG